MQLLLADLLNLSIELFVLVVDMVLNEWLLLSEGDKNELASRFLPRPTNYESYVKFLL